MVACIMLFLDTERLITCSNDILSSHQRYRLVPPLQIMMIHQLGEINDEYLPQKLFNGVFTLNQ